MWSSFPSSLPNFFTATNSKTVQLSTGKIQLNAELTFLPNIEWIEPLYRVCQCLRWLWFYRSTRRERCKFHSLLGSVGKLGARQTVTFQPLPSITSVESPKIWKTRDQPKPGLSSGRWETLGTRLTDFKFKKVANLWVLFNLTCVWFM